MTYRFVIDTAYKGTGYSGWERQATTGKTIQAEVEKALLKVLREPVGVYGAGRTDSGVHALQMPAHFDYSKPELHPAFMVAINSLLPENIAVMKVYKTVRENFHARFHAQWRSYEYRIVFQKHPILNNLSFFCRKRPDFDLLQKAAAIIAEYNHFESFCKRAATSRGFNCDIMHSFWEWQGDVLVYKVKAHRFLRGMVRTMVGTMLDVGTGKITPDELRSIIESNDRNRAGASVFAGGLFLTGVGYKENELIELKDLSRRLSEEDLPEG